MSGISIIIVNYNVKYFIRQCLQSVYKSDYGGPLEVIVIDNDSVDGSQEMIRQEFPQVILVANAENVGFSKANNQGIALAQYAHTLILNPDTIIQEDTLSACALFMDNTPDAGAVGVKMVDGSGSYLPESKRGFPTPLSSLFKMSGLSKVFSKSKVVNSYYLGHLDPDVINEVEVLTGAFSYMRTALLQEIGGFDEDYFMYGEDIELSFQVKEKGYKSYFYPDTQIIHFKGESTKKLSSTYLRNFYGAMSIYAGKRKSASSMLWSWILNLGIFISALTSVFKKISFSSLRPILDTLLLYLVVMGFQTLWANFYFGDANYYGDASFGWTYIFLVFIIVGSYYLFGQYDERHNYKHMSYSFLVSTLAVLSVYSLLPTELRFSRLLLLATCMSAPFVLFITRRVFNKLIKGISSFNTIDGKRVAVVGTLDSCNKTGEVVKKFSGTNSLIGQVHLDGNHNDSLGTISDIAEIVESRMINEVIFCSSDMQTSDIFKTMSQLGNKIDFKVANNDNTTIVGSSSKERVGQWYTLDINFRIDEPFHRRTKRLIDLFIIFLAIILFPIFIFSTQRKKLYGNLFQVLIGSKTWRGYNLPDKDLAQIPLVRHGVFGVGLENDLTSDSYHQSNLWYARNYSTWIEFSALLNTIFAR